MGEARTVFKRRVMRIAFRLLLSALAKEKTWLLAIGTLLMCRAHDLRPMDPEANELNVFKRVLPKRVTVPVPVKLLA